MCSTAELRWRMNHVAQEFALMIENPYTGLVLMRAAHLNLRHVAQECHFLSHSALGAKEYFYFTYRLALRNVWHNVTYTGRRSARKETLAEKLNANRVWLWWSKRSPEKSDRSVCSWTNERAFVQLWKTLDSEQPVALEEFYCPCIFHVIQT